MDVSNMFALNLNFQAFVDDRRKRIKEKFPIGPNYPEVNKILIDVMTMGDVNLDAAIIISHLLLGVVARRIDSFGRFDRFQIGKVIDDLILSYERFVSKGSRYLILREQAPYQIYVLLLLRPAEQKFTLPDSIFENLPLVPLFEEI